MASPEISKTMPIRVLVADQHPVIRIGVENLLHTETEITVVGEAGDSHQAIARALELSPDILLLALNLPGLDAMRIMVNRLPAIKTILLTNVISQPEIQRAQDVGARGLVLKDALLNNLTSAIRAVFAGKYWVGDHRAASLSNALPASPKKQAPVEKKPITLTRRELQVVGCVLQGSSNRDIAHQFHLSEETVKRHLSNIFDKTGVSTRLELALYAIEHQLVASRS
ncbi:response regulator transcription factor [Alloacidobacterium sp.]|uniref:response regulator transcription factor n=1 Tax=Alloacidobacterium sp. TaxID=2951999 RepID=UPI002D439BD0|nr:response regulator transcription factor [Alloacidobacterium sp.]HYK35633.1 response regulator transcription factor [Alloacidobacterium sp.]